MAPDKLDDLRLLLRGRMAELDDSFTSAARAMGVSDVVLHTFITGRALSVSMCLRLARYLSMPASVVLRMAGHAREAELLEEDVPYTVDPTPRPSALEKLLEGLDDEEKQVAITAMIGIAEGLKKRRKTRNKRSQNE